MLEEVCVVDVGVAWNGETLLHLYSVLSRDDLCHAEGEHFTSHP